MSIGIKVIWALARNRPKSLVPSYPKRDSRTIDVSINPAADKPRFDVFVMHSMKAFLSGSSHRIAMIAEGSIITMENHFYRKAFLPRCDCLVQVASRNAQQFHSVPQSDVECFAVVLVFVVAQQVLF